MQSNYKTEEGIIKRFKLHLYQCLPHHKQNDISLHPGSANPTQFRGALISVIKVSEHREGSCRGRPIWLND